MLSDDELIDYIRQAATEKLPIAVMTVKEMRQFAQKVALDCAEIVGRSELNRNDVIKLIKERYEYAQP